MNTENFETLKQTVHLIEAEMQKNPQFLARFKQDPKTAIREANLPISDAAIEDFKRRAKTNDVELKEVVSKKVLLWLL